MLLRLTLYGTEYKIFMLSGCAPKGVHKNLRMNAPRGKAGRFKYKCIPEEYPQ